MSQASSMKVAPCPFPGGNNFYAPGAGEMLCLRKLRAFRSLRLLGSAVRSHLDILAHVLSVYSRYRRRSLIFVAHLAIITPAPPPPPPPPPPPAGCPRTSVLSHLDILNHVLGVYPSYRGRSLTECVVLVIVNFMPGVYCGRLRRGYLAQGIYGGFNFQQGIYGWGGGVR